MPTATLGRMASTVALLQLLAASCGGTGGAGGGIAPSCVRQLQQDGCSPVTSVHLHYAAKAHGGAHSCGDCAKKHKDDLLKANCTAKDCELWCTDKHPPAPPAPGPAGCSITLTKQLSHSSCTLGTSFGCAGHCRPMPSAAPPAHAVR